MFPKPPRTIPMTISTQKITLNLIAQNLVTFGAFFGGFVFLTK
jgi:hypothetical protein